MKAIGKIEVHGVGFVDIIDEDSSLIGEYFLEYMRKKIENGYACVEVKQEPKKETITQEPKKETLNADEETKLKRGRKKGGMMSCEEKIKRYVEDRISFSIKSFQKRYSRFTEDEVVQAISDLIKEKYIYQISNDEIGVHKRLQ